MKKVILSFCLVLSFVFNGCAAMREDDSDTETESKETSDYSENDTTEANEYITDTKTIEEEVETDQEMPDANGITYFTFDLFGELTEGENILISPLSALTAIAMAGNGADGETLSEIESTIGYEIRNANKLLRAYLQNDSEKAKLLWSNSLWCNESALFVPYESFTDTLRQSYDAEIYSLPFDAGAIPKINDWVNEKTDGMIERVIEDISEETVLYVINTVLFEAEWGKSYESPDINESNFFCENGEVVRTEFMKSIESYYLSSNDACGFIKYYKDKRFAFIGLLPNEGISIEEYRKSMDALTFNEILRGVESASVTVRLPQFTVEYENELSDELISLGMKNAFDPQKADFSKLGASVDDIYIKQVIHKTKIEVGELGTKAGAATVIEMPMESELCGIYDITLNRPFVYVIYDFENEAPIFIGTLTNP